MKKVLILVLSADVPPYKKMLETACRTWDSINVENCETVYYCDKSSKPNTANIIYLPTNFSLHTMGHKTLAAFEWAWFNKRFDYVARVHSSIYVDKKELIKFVEELPDENVFSCVEAQSQNGFSYGWGGVGYIISADVIKRIIDNKHIWNHQYMEDESLSLVVKELGIPFHSGNKACSIDRKGEGWQCISYYGKSIDFNDFADLKPLEHFYYRIKQDGKREMDEVVMNELFKVL